MHRPAFPLLIGAVVLAGLWAWDSRDTSVVGLGAVSIVFYMIAVVGVYYLLIGLRMAKVLIGAILAVVPVGLFSGTLIALILSVQDGFEARIVQALIAAVVVASGWVIAYLTAEWSRVGAEQERRRDIIRAAISELELIQKHSEIADWDKAIADATDQLRDPDHRVFIYYGHQYATLRRLVDQIEVLEWEQITAVMEAFQALDRLDRMQERMDSDAFVALPVARRKEGLLRFLRLHAQISGLSQNAITALRNGPFQGWARHLK